MWMNVTSLFIRPVSEVLREMSASKITMTCAVLLNTSRAVARGVGVAFPLARGTVSAIYLLRSLVAGVILLEALAK